MHWFARWAIIVGPLAQEVFVEIHKGVWVSRLVARKKCGWFQLGTVWWISFRLKDKRVSIWFPDFKRQLPRPKTGSTKSGILKIAEFVA